MNTYFQFKQFTIHQDKCAMKVTEIACILGAWSTIPPHAKKILDIGCGTGLLSLMMAQQNNTVEIDAVEIAESCVAQAKENIENSIFNQRIHCIQADIQNFYPAHQYDFIISNPPFFEQQLKSSNKLKNIAWHSDALPLQALIETIDRLLKPSGCFSILLPVQRREELLKICLPYSFYLFKNAQLRHSNQHPITHEMCSFSRTPQPLLTEIISIKENGEYSNAIINLLRAFYLKL